MRFLLALAFLLSAEAALACSCAPPMNEADKRDRARQIAIGVVLVAEVEVLEGLDPESRRGELLRPVRTHLGDGTRTYRIAREPGRFYSSASCDIVYEEGGKAFAVLYPADHSWQEGHAIAREWAKTDNPCEQATLRERVARIHEDEAQLYRNGGLCSDLFVDEEMVSMIIEEARKLGRDIN